VESIKLKISNKKTLPTFIDEGLNKMICDNLTSLTNIRCRQASLTVEDHPCMPSGRFLVSPNSPNGLIPPADSNTKIQT
jgi:hypothetical protein